MRDARRDAPEIGTVGQKARKTQERVVALFRELGYACLGSLRRLAALRDRPHDEGLAPPHVAGGENAPRISRRLTTSTLGPHTEVSLFERV